MTGKSCVLRYGLHHFTGQFTVFFRMCAVVVVEADQELGEIGFVFFLHGGNQLFRLDTILACTQHNGRAVGIIGTDVVTEMTLQSLKTCPYISLDVLHQMAQVYRPVCIGQGAGDKNFSLRGHGVLVCCLISRAHNLSREQRAIQA
jgi:hypothetical protein